MKLSLQQLLTLILLALFAAFSSPAVAKDFSLLTLSISVADKSYLVGEPVKVTVNLSNDTSETITGHKRIDPAYGLLSIMISTDGKEFKKYNGPGWGVKDAYIKPVKISPGDTASRDILILYNRKGSLSDEIKTMTAFPTAGHYVVKAVLNALDYKKKIESQPVEFEITEPKGTDALAWKLLKSENGIYFLHTGYPKDDHLIVKKFERAAREYPDSKYTRYVKDALSQYKVVKEKLPRIEKEGISEEEETRIEDEANKVVLGWSDAMNKKQYDVVIDYASSQAVIRETWEKGGKTREELVKHLDGVSEKLGEISIEVNDISIRNDAVSLDITVNSKKQGVFDSFINMQKDRDGRLRIVQTGF